MKYFYLKFQCRFSVKIVTEEGAPQSGKDWEVIHEQDKKDKIDPRLADLANFFDQDD